MWIFWRIKIYEFHRYLNFFCIETKEQQHYTISIFKSIFERLCIQTFWKQGMNFCRSHLILQPSNQNFIQSFRKAFSWKKSITATTININTRVHEVAFGFSTTRHYCYVSHQLSIFYCFLLIFGSPFSILKIKLRFTQCRHCHLFSNRWNSLHVHTSSVALGSITFCFGSVTACASMLLFQNLLLQLLLIQR